jgi:hypothetical protein
LLDAKGFRDLPLALAGQSVRPIVWCLVPTDAIKMIGLLPVASLKPVANGSSRCGRRNGS